MTLYPLAVITVVLGFWPLPVFNLINTSLHSLMKVVKAVGPM